MHTQFRMAATRRLAALIVVFISSFSPAIAQQDNKEPATVELQAETTAEPVDQVELASDSLGLQKSDLLAQERMAEATVAMNNATQSMKWAAWVSVLIGAGGLTALIWTFREQRKLFKADNQAYIEIIEINTFTHGTYGLSLGIHVANRGKTPARNMTFNGTFTYFRPEREDYPIGAYLSLLPAGASRAVTGRCHEMLYHFDLLLDVEKAGSHGRITGSRAVEDPEHTSYPSIMLDGLLTWEDSYGGKNSVRVLDSAELLRENEPIWSYNRHRDRND